MFALLYYTDGRDGGGGGQKRRGTRTTTVTVLRHGELRPLLGADNNDDSNSSPPIATPASPSPPLSRREKNDHRLRQQHYLYGEDDDDASPLILIRRKRRRSQLCACACMMIIPGMLLVCGGTLLFQGRQQQRQNNAKERWRRSYIFSRRHHHEEDSITTALQGSDPVAIIVTDPFHDDEDIVINSHHGNNAASPPKDAMNDMKSNSKNNNKNNIYDPYSQVQVVRSRDGYPSYGDYEGLGPMDVSYDARSIQINGDRVLLLGGSMHPARATKQTWDHALDEAVLNGLNLVTIYVVWSVHQPYPDQPLTWSLDQQCRDRDYTDDVASVCDGDSSWDLADAIRAAARRGLFVHIRIGPYICAEWAYGGIPEHVPTSQMSMRRPNREWMRAMSKYVTAVIGYLADQHLWAFQGGPIILGQIENELGIEDDHVQDKGSSSSPAQRWNAVKVDRDGRFVDNALDVDGTTTTLRDATIQDYANWCGDLVAELAPNVTWTMCSGLSAPNTVETYDGVDATEWLESRGESKRIQSDQPAIWTENEGGFQIWGETATEPTDYFWGRRARDMANSVVRWFARGGAHMNYYMWWGGYNRGRSAAAGIMNGYATDAILCSSTQRHQPKFAHLESLHRVIADVAPILLNAPTALNRSEPVECYNGSWEECATHKQRMFAYRSPDGREVLFVENDVKQQVRVRVPVTHRVVTGGAKKTRVFTIQPQSSLVIVDGFVDFDSAALHPRATANRRVIADSSVFVDWVTWPEPIGAPHNDPQRSVSGSTPWEQTALNVDRKVLSDYAWYQTEIILDSDLHGGMLFVDTWKANALLVYVDDKLAGFNNTHFHQEGNTTLEIQLGDTIPKGKHSLSILSESLGYGNLIGRWGVSTKAKSKGLTGDVDLFSREADTGAMTMNQRLVDGRLWRSAAGLHGKREVLGGNKPVAPRHLRSSSGQEAVSSTSSPQWTAAKFDTPQYSPANQGLFLDIASGRGHLWLNGNDLGRYWNITRGNTSTYSQRYYFLPHDFLYTSTDGRLNEIVLFDVFGGTADTRHLHNTTRLVLSWIEPSGEPSMKDEVDFPYACI